MANEFKIKKGLIVEGASGGTVVDVQGSQGQLFSVTDDLSGSIFAVSDISGVPILDINSSGDSNFSGDVLVEDNLYLTDAGTVRAKLLLNSSDRDNVELRAESLGSTMKFFTVGTEALGLDAQQFATFATRVGVGVTASTNAMLDVKGPDTDDAVLGRFWSNTGARGSFIIRNGTGVDPTTFIGTAGGSEELSIGTDNTEAIRIDASSTPNATFAGKVGIGITTTPIDELEIGNLSNYTGLTLKGVGASRPAITFKNVTQSLLGAIYGTEGRGIIIETGGNGTAGTVALTLSSAGSLKLNTYTAGTLVSDASGNITVSSGGGAGGPYLPVANPTFTGVLTGPSADLEFIKLTSANPGIMLKETDTTDKNWDIQVNSGRLKIYEVNDARTVFNEHVTVGSGGNVGIGFTSPEAAPLASTKLSVNGNTYVAGTLGVGNTSPPVQFVVNNGIVRTSTAKTYSTFVHTNDTDDYRVGLATAIKGGAASADRYISIEGASYQVSTDTFTNEDIDLVLNPAAGNVGIGTTNPERILHLDADQGRAIIQLDKGGDKIVSIGTGSSATGADDTILQLINEGVEKVRIFTEGNSWLNGGKVGIGTTNPDYALDVMSSIVNSSARFRNSAGGDTLVRIIAGNYNTEIDARLFIGEADTYGMTFEYDGSANVGYIGMNDNVDPTGAFSKRISMSRGGTEVIFPAGKVGIGTTNPGAALEIANEDLNVDNTILNIGNAIVAPNTRDSWIKMFASQNTSDKTFAIGNAYGKFVVNYLGTRATNPLSAGSKIFTVDGPNGNVGIGTYTPNAKLDVQGTQGQLFSVTDDLSGDIFSVADISGVPIMNVNSDGTSYFDGDVGIGTASPTDPLTVTSTSNSLGIRLNYPVTNSLVYPFYVGNEAGTSYVRANNTAIAFKKNGAACTLKTEGSTNDLIIESANNLSFKTNGTLNTRMTILGSNGNVGIGTTSPGVKLQVEGSIQANAQGRFKGWYTSGSGLALETGVSGGNGYVLTYNRDTSAYSSTIIESTGIQFAAHSSGKFYFTGGNVGIGTTSPSTKLEVTGHVTINSPAGASQTSYGLRLRKTNSSSAVQAGGEILASPYPNNTNAANLIFKTADTVANLTQRMVIDGVGNVGIGGNAPSYLLDVRDGTSSGAIARFSAINPHVIIESSTAGPAVLHLKPNQTGNKSGQFKVTAGNGYNFRWSNDAAGTGETTYMVLDTSTTGGGDLTVKGDIIAYGAPSDRKYKENIKPIESALDKAMQLQGVTFDWKETDGILDIKEDIGFIAQDVEKVLPELVRDNGKGNLSLRYQGITPILLEAIKELKEEIEELKKQIK
jgi:hypothetical protein